MIKFGNASQDQIFAQTDFGCSAARVAAELSSHDPVNSLSLRGHRTNGLRRILAQLDLRSHRVVLR